MGTKLAARALEYLITQIKDHVNQDTGENKATSPETATLLGLQVRSTSFVARKRLRSGPFM